MISGVTAAERYQATADVNGAISAAGGWVVDHTSFSNVAITIQFSLPSQRPDELRDRVIAAHPNMLPISRPCSSPILAAGSMRVIDLG